MQVTVTFFCKSRINRLKGIKTTLKTLYGCKIWLE